MAIIIHVNRHHIAANEKDGGNRPIYSVKAKNKTRYAREVIIHGPSRFVYDGSRLKCGARAWLEVADGISIELIDKVSYKDIKA